MLCCGVYAICLHHVSQHSVVVVIGDNVTVLWIHLDKNMEMEHALAYHMLIESVVNL